MREIALNLKHLAGDAWPLAALAAGISLLLAGLHVVTGEMIERNESARLRQMLTTMMGLEKAESDPLAELTLVQPLPALFTICIGGIDASSDAAGVNAGFHAEGLRRYHFVTDAARGYGGPIRYLASFTGDGRLRTVRIIAHSETPGLGDQIESDRSDWLMQFTGLRPAADDPGWALSADGGRFDALTGATITARAMVDALAASGERLTQSLPRTCDHVVDAG